MNWMDFFLSAKGRIPRVPFWIGWVVITAAIMLVAPIPAFGWFLGMALLWPYACIFAKRLHDIGKPAWMLLLPVGVSIASGAILMARLGEAAERATLSQAPERGVAISVMVTFVLWVGLMKGDPNENRYGPPTAAK